MTKISRINLKNQVLIPVSVRKSLNLKPGDRVEFIQVASDRYELLAVNKDIHLLRGRFSTDKSPISIDAMNHAISESAARANASLRMGDSVEGEEFIQLLLQLLPQ